MQRLRFVDFKRARKDPCTEQLLHFGPLHLTNEHTSLEPRSR